MTTPELDHTAVPPGPASSPRARPTTALVHPSFWAGARRTRDLCTDEALAWHDQAAARRHDLLSRHYADLQAAGERDPSAGWILPVADRS